MVDSDIAERTRKLKPHFEKVMERRSADVSFDRFETASISCDGNSLHLDVIDVGRDNPTVVFVPGTAVYGLTFGDFLSGLADRGVNIVAFDPRGHGRSTGAPGDYTIMEIVADAHAAIAYAKSRFDGPIFISGSSQGGLAAFYTAATDVEIDGAICHNVADLADPANADTTAHPIFTRLAKPLLRGLAGLFPHASFNLQRYYGLLSKGDDVVKNRLAEDPLSLKVISLRALASLASEPLPRPVESIRTPIMIVHGAEDTIFKQPLIESLFARLNCEKQLSIYPDRDHFLFTERIEEVIPDIVKWIEERAS